MFLITLIQIRLDQICVSSWLDHFCTLIGKKNSYSFSFYHPAMIGPSVTLTKRFKINTSHKRTFPLLGSLSADKYLLS